MRRQIMITLFAGLLGACGGDDLAEAPNLEPKAVITNGDRTVIEDTSIDFDGSESSDRDGIIKNYAWNFGDGTVLESGGATVAHTYSDSGTFTLTLTVTDDLGADGSTTATMTVLAEGENVPPTVSIDTPTSPIASGTSVTLKGTASDSDGSITSWTWNFGDGTSEESGTVQSDGTNTVVHTFSNSTSSDLSYTITLSVEDNVGLSTNATQTIVVNAAGGSSTNDYSGLWNWQLAAGEPNDPSGLGLCAFQDSVLDIQVDSSAGSITITEMLNNVAQATYTGTISGDTFSASYDSVVTAQIIAGTFASTTSFTGTYEIDMGGNDFTGCEGSRNVEGFKQ